MKILTVSLATLVVAFANLSASEWKISGNDKSASVTVVEDPKLMVKTSVNDATFTITLTDGKQKFGASVIGIQNGDVTYKRPRLTLSIPLSVAKNVSSDKPLLVTGFSHKETQFEIHLVDNTSSDIPDTLITQK